MSTYKFIPEEVFPKIPAELDLELLSQVPPIEDVDLNPAPDYKLMQAEWVKMHEDEKEEEEVGPTILPLEQTGPKEEVDYYPDEPKYVWKDGYYIGENFAYKRIVQVADKKKDIARKVYYKKTRFRDVKFPEKKKQKKKDWEFDTSK